MLFTLTAGSIINSVHLKVKLLSIMFYKIYERKTQVKYNGKPTLKLHFSWTCQSNWSIHHVYSCLAKTYFIKWF